MADRYQRMTTVTVASSQTRALPLWDLGQFMDWLSGHAKSIPAEHAASARIEFWSSEDGQIQFRLAYKRPATPEDNEADRREALRKAADLQAQADRWRTIASAAVTGER